MTRSDASPEVREAFDGLPLHVRRRAERRLQHLARWDELTSSIYSNRVAAARQVAAEAKAANPREWINQKTLYTWHARFRRFGLLGLVDQRFRKAIEREAAGR